MKKSLKFKEPRTRKSWVKLLDDLVRKAVYARDGYRSVKSGKTENLNPSHIYPKGRYIRMRWLVDNILTLTWDEHLNWWHKNPIEASEWFNEKYPERAKKLKLISQLNYKTKIDYEAEKLYLENEIKKHEDRI